MGLLPLEFTDGLTDSPFFRETLQAHERELDLTNTAIKHLIKDIKDLIAAARSMYYLFYFIFLKKYSGKFWKFFLHVFYSCSPNMFFPFYFYFNILLLLLFSI